MNLVLNDRQTKIWQNLGKLFELNTQHETLIDSEDIAPRYLPTLFNRQKIVNGQILRLTEILLNSVEVSESDAAPSQIPFLESAETLQQHLEAIIPVLSPGQAEYISLPKDTFNDAEFERLLTLLESLAVPKIIGYRIEKDVVRIVLKFRKGRTA